MTSREGMILVTTLWILALLTLLAIGIGVRMAVDIKLVGFSLNSLKARYLAEAGLRRTTTLFEGDGSKIIDSLNEVWSCGYDFDEEEYVLKDIELGEGAFTVGYEFGKDEDENPIYLYGASDEEGKLNINKIDAKLLAKLPGFTDEIVAAVLDWRDEDSLTIDGAEDEYYKGLDNPYECKDAPLSVPEELLLVKGVTEEIYDGVKDIITVYPIDGDGKVNINTAPEEVLAVLVGGEEFEDRPGKIIKDRNGQDNEPGTKDDEIFNDINAIAANYFLNKTQKGYFKFSSNTFRVVSRGEVKGGRAKQTIEAVVKRGEEASEILYYYED